MPERLKLHNILKEAGDGGGAVHANIKDFASFITGDGTLDWKNLIPDSPFGKNKPHKRRGTDVSNTKDGGVAHAIAQALFSADLAEKGLQDLGVSVSDLSDQDTIDYYKALKQFPLQFSLNKKIDGFFGGKKDNIKGKASVDQRSNAKKFVMYFTDGSTNEVYRMNFLPQSLQKNLKGTAFDLPMLIKNEFYKVRVSLKELSDDDGWGDPGTKEPEEKEPTKGEEEPIEVTDPNDENPPVPPEIKKNRNEIFRLLLKNYGGYNGEVVYGDGFLSKEEAAEYQKLMRGIKKGEVEKSEAQDFRKNSSRTKYSMMIANLRKSFPVTFLKKLDKAFPEFNLSYQKSVEESFEIIKEEDNPDKYKRWSIVFGKEVGNKTIDELDKNIRGFMAAVKKWFASPIMYRGKTQSYNIDFDGDAVNQYWSNFYGGNKGPSKKEESVLSINNILNEILTERRPPKGKTSAPKGTRVGLGDYWEDKEKLPKYYDRVIKLNDIPTFSQDKNVISGKEEENEEPIFVGKIEITDGGGNPTWSLTGAQNEVNKELKKGVKIRASKKFKDKALVIEWERAFDLGGKPTKAMLISPIGISLQEFLAKTAGSGIRDVEIEIGRKAGGDEDIKNPAKGKVDLKLKK
jgi:hypothetical protein